ncbi:MAG: Maf family protein [Ferruginibacter sp.]
MQKIILASGSPRRKQLLEWAEIEFDVMVSDTDESFPKGISFADAAMHIAFNKALAVKEKLPATGVTILAADTIVVCNNRIIGKPKDRQDALDILAELSGNSHEVITGVAILAGNKEILFADTTAVSFHPLTAEQIAFYVDKYQPYDKAGAYAIQEWIGVVGIKRVEGCFYNVMGLPVSRVVQALQAL